MTAVKLFGIRHWANELLSFTLQLTTAGFIIDSFERFALLSKMRGLIDPKVWSDGLSENWNVNEVESAMFMFKSKFDAVIWVFKWYKQTRWFHRIISTARELTVLFGGGPLFSCLLLDSFELQEMACLEKHGATFCSHNISVKRKLMLGLWWICFCYDNFPSNVGNCTICLWHW